MAAVNLFVCPAADVTALPHTHTRTDDDDNQPDNKKTSSRNSREMKNFSLSWLPKSFDSLPPLYLVGLFVFFFPFMGFRLQEEKRPTRKVQNFNGKQSPDDYTTVVNSSIRKSLDDERPSTMLLIILS